MMTSKLGMQATWEQSHYQSICISRFFINVPVFHMQIYVPSTFPLHTLSSTIEPLIPPLQGSEWGYQRTPNSSASETYVMAKRISSEPGRSACDFWKTMLLKTNSRARSSHCTSKHSAAGEQLELLGFLGAHNGSRLTSWICTCYDNSPDCMLLRYT